MWKIFHSNWGSVNSHCSLTFCSFRIWWWFGFSCLCPLFQIFLEVTTLWTHSMMILVTHLMMIGKILTTISQQMTHQMKMHKVSHPTALSHFLALPCTTMRYATHTFLYFFTWHPFSCRIHKLILLIDDHVFLCRVFFVNFYVFVISLNVKLQLLRILFENFYKITEMLCLHWLVKTHSCFQNFSTSLTCLF